MSCKRVSSRFLTSLESNTIYIKSNESDPLCKNTTKICGERGSQSNPVFYDEVQDIIGTMLSSASPIVLKFTGSGSFGRANTLYSYSSSVIFKGEGRAAAKLVGRHEITPASANYKQQSVDDISVTFTDVTLVGGLAVAPGCGNLSLVGTGCYFSDEFPFPPSSPLYACAVSAGFGDAYTCTLTDCTVTGLKGHVVYVDAGDNADFTVGFNSVTFRNTRAGDDAPVSITVSGAGRLTLNTAFVDSLFTLGPGQTAAVFVKISDNAVFNETQTNNRTNVVVEPEVVYAVTATTTTAELWQADDAATLNTIRTGCVVDIEDYCWLQIGGTVGGSDAIITVTSSNAIYKGCINAYLSQSSSLTFTNVAMTGGTTIDGGIVTLNGSQLEGDISLTDVSYSVDNTRIQGALTSSNSIGSMNGSSIKSTAPPQISSLTASDPQAIEAVVLEAVVLEGGSLVVSNSRMYITGYPSVFGMYKGADITVAGSLIRLYYLPDSPYFVGYGSDTAVSISGSRFTGAEGRAAIDGVGTVSFSASNYFEGSNVVVGADTVVEFASGFAPASE